METFKNLNTQSVDTALSNISQVPGGWVYMYVFFRYIKWECTYGVHMLIVIDQ